MIWAARPPPTLADATHLSQRPSHVGLAVGMAVGVGVGRLVVGVAVGVGTLQSRGRCTTLASERRRHGAWRGE